MNYNFDINKAVVAIHNKNGKGLLQNIICMDAGQLTSVAIHNKNGQGLLPSADFLCQSFHMVAIHNKNGQGLLHIEDYERFISPHVHVAIHNKNGQGLLQNL